MTCPWPIGSNGTAPTRCWSTCANLTSSPANTFQTRSTCRSRSYAPVTPNYQSIAMSGSAAPWTTGVLRHAFPGAAWVSVLESVWRLHDVQGAQGRRPGRVNGTPVNIPFLKKRWEFSCSAALANSRVASLCHQLMSGSGSGSCRSAFLLAIFASIIFLEGVYNGRRAEFRTKLCI